MSEGKATRRWAALALLCVAQFVDVLDINAGIVALPVIGRDLGFAPEDLQWVITAYVLFFGGFLLLAGRLSDLYGRRRIFVVGLVVFTASSLACGLAGSPPMLVAFRVSGRRSSPRRRSPSSRVPFLKAASGTSPWACGRR